MCPLIIFILLFSFFFFLKLNEHVLTAGQTGLVHILCQYVATSLVLFLGDIRDVFVHVTSFQSRGFLKSQGLWQEVDVMLDQLAADLSLAPGYRTSTCTYGVYQVTFSMVFIYRTHMVLILARSQISTWFEFVWHVSEGKKKKSLQCFLISC